MRVSVRTVNTKTSSREPAYFLFAINFYDNGLKAVREEYIKRVKDGLRRSVFIIDIESEIQEAITYNEANVRSSKPKKPMVRPSDPLTIVQNFIEDSCQEYDYIGRKIQEELQFNIFDYWLNNMKADAFKHAKSKERDKEKRRTNDTMRNTKVKTSKKDLKQSIDDKFIETVCYALAPKEHNKVGKGRPLSKRIYIQDQPFSSKLFIVVIGGMGIDFYMDLLRNRLPLRAIIHFLPEECAYDLLVPRPRREKFLQETIQNIQNEIRQLRKRITTKAIGIFQQQIPVMSSCLASKFSCDIFDQLSWFLYDRETVREWYQLFYIAPFNETNVKMSPQANLMDTFIMAESLSIQGHYLKSPIPAMISDSATIYMYIESLLSTFGSPRELLTEMEVLMLANPSSAIPTKVLDKIKVYVNAFMSVLKMKKSHHLFIEETNGLLHNIIMYTKQSPLRNIYHACLEYNILRRYFSTGYITNSLNYKIYNGEMEPHYLPKYAKLYLTHDCTLQRIVELIDKYDEYTIEETSPNVKLYTFKRVFNEVFEYEKETVIPTRLCFRDFTLYDMDTFLNDLVTPEMYNKAREERELDHILHQLSISTIQSGGDNEIFTMRLKDGQEIKIDLSIFIRPTSLKARKHPKEQNVNDNEQESNEKRTVSVHSGHIETKRASRQKSKRGRTRNSLQDSLLSQHSFENVDNNYVGLKPGHPMLQGYNLDDSRQTIKTKVSKYHFEEGKLHLYEERWNFSHINKTLMLEVNMVQLFFNCLLQDIKKTSRNFRLKTKNEVSLRVFTEDSECAKVVINYPIGLSIFCHEKHAEQLWVKQETPNDERRRIFTPYGCVIVFYNADDIVLIMRYNGEIFYLYNYLEEAEEEEEGISEFTNFYSNNSSGSVDATSKTNKKRKTKQSVNGAEGGRSIEALDVKPPVKSAKRKSKGPRANIKHAVLSSIDCEMKYLEFIMTLYKLDYLHLKLVTALGRIVHVVKPGKVYAARALLYSEWRDYFMNEEYVMREDGVKLLWTVDEMKCYHADGTVIITKTLEGFDAGVLSDELDKQVTQSSSHENFNSSRGETRISTTLYINDRDDMPFDLISQDSLMTKKPGSDNQMHKKNKKSTFKPNIEYEEEEAIYYDPSFITFTSNSYFMQHKFYAGILFTFEQIESTDLIIQTEVFAADNLHIKISQEVTTDENEEELEEENIESPQTSSQADPDELTKINIKSTSKRSKQNDSMGNTTIQIDCNEIMFIVKEKSIDLDLHLRRFGCAENVCVIRDHVFLNLNFNKSLLNLFYEWVEKLGSFINCFCPKWKTLYFIELTMDDCKKKGFELLSKVPPLQKYNFCASNVILDIQALESLANRMENSYLWYDTDMRKYPRFQKCKKKLNSTDFPMVLSVNIFVEIPNLLTNTDRIYQFVDPFDKISFRKLKSRLEEALMFHLHPNLRIMLMQEISRRSWKTHHLEHQRRLFLEQQRLGLYMAMLKHKVYPNYFQFVNQFFGHVRNIDFFDFMTAKCNEKSNPSKYKEGAVLEEEAHSVPKTNNRRKNKCLCPKYIKSFK